MDLLTGLFALGFLVSLQGNGILFYLLRKSRKTPTPTIEAQKVLAAFSSGRAILKIDVIDAGDILLRSPRG